MAEKPGRDPADPPSEQESRPGVTLATLAVDDRGNITWEWKDRR